MNGLSIIIPSKTLTNLWACMGAIRLCNEKARIIVVDDTENGIRPLPNYPRVDEPVIVPGIKPFIFSRNVNIGIETAGSDDVVILNDDARLETEHGFSLLQKTAAKHPEFGIIAATTNNVGNRNQMPKGIGLREDPRMVCFVAVLIPRRTIDKVGLLDEEFIGYGFDDDSYCLRTRRAGLKIGIDDGCFVDHASLPSTFRSGGYTGPSMKHNEAIFRAKYGAGHAEL